MILKFLKIELVLITLFSLISCDKKLETLKESDTNSYVFTSEIELTDLEKLNEIEDFYNSVKGKTFIGVDFISIYYKTFLQAKVTKGAILISTGRTESAIKYKELIFDLYSNGYSIYIHDHRGQGLSGRMTSDYELGFVEDFQDYITDMKTFYETIIKPNNHKKVYLMAHSMGGAIGFTYLQQFPNDFKAAAFSSPMFGLNFGLCALGGVLENDEPSYAPTQTNFLESSVNFENNILTNSEVRYNLFTEAYMKEPLVRLGGISVHWLNESCNQFKIMFDGISKVKTPSLVFSAVEEEIVDPAAHFMFVEESIPKNKLIKGYSVKNAKHELFIEKDAVRNNVLSTILNFFEAEN